jgi:succinate-semialdehyde dehydrogenase/glutarate-semialdehyde dehydrogenase
MNAPLTADVAAERSRLALKRPDLLREAAYIDGQWRGAEGTLLVTNPANGRPLGRIPDLGANDASDAVAAADRALAGWKRRTARERGQILRRWFELMMANQEDLARLMTAEQGKPLDEARGEIAYAGAFFEWFAEEGRRAYGEVIPPHADGRRLIVTREPVGVVSAITPWNFPAAMITRKVGPALAAGCTVVLKPSELTPFSALALAVLGEEAGVPAGVFNIVTGRPDAIGAVLTEDPRIAKFSFTGSTGVGKMLAARCMSTVKRVSLELGGNAPFIVLDDADLDAAVEGAIASKFRNTGQTCVCANRFLVQSGVYDAFAERLAARADALTVGDGLDGPTQQGPLINDKAVAKVARHIADARDLGAVALTGGEAHRLGGDFWTPTVLTGVPSTALLNREETFGPVAGLIRIENDAEAIALANDTRAGLAAYLYAKDLSRAWKVQEALQYGMVGVNTGLISTEVAPFGGVKESGFGREGSHLGLDEYLSVKFTCLAI